MVKRVDVYTTMATAVGNRHMIKGCNCVTVRAVCWFWHPGWRLVLPIMCVKIYTLNIGPHGTLEKATRLIETMDKIYKRSKESSHYVRCGSLSAACLNSFCLLSLNRRTVKISSKKGLRALFMMEGNQEQRDIKSSKR